MISSQGNIQTSQPTYFKNQIFKQNGFWKPSTAAKYKSMRKNKQFELKTALSSVNSSNKVKQKLYKSEIPKTKESCFGGEEGLIPVELTVAELGKRGGVAWLVAELCM